MTEPIEQTDAVVIGAGVIGCAVAWRLGQAGMRVVVVERGTLEVMIGGATQYLSAGSHVRVPRAIPFGYRNVGDEPAYLLSRSLAPARAVRRVTIEIAAAG